MQLSPSRRIGYFVVTAFLLASVSPGAASKKEDVKRRLRSLELIHVEGTGQAAAYASRHLMKETCLKRALSADEADAVLEVWEHPAACRSALSRICLEVSMKLVDQETKKVLYFRSDNELGSALSLNTADAAGKWVLWNLNGACCKGR